MHKNEPKTGGIALLCDEQGALVKVLRDDLDLIAQDNSEQNLNISAGQPWTALVDRGSLQKALNFLVEVKKKGATFDWEMNVPTERSVMSLHFAGAIAEDNMLIVGAKSSKDVMALYEEMMRISNQQTNTLRTVLKNQSQTPTIGDEEEDERAAREERDNALYDEVTRLNNELVTMQRELARKNAELERLNEKAQREIAKRKQMQEALARSNSDLEEFAYIASHDLQAPLRKIRVFGERLKARYGDELEDRGRDYLNRMERAINRMQELIHDLLTYSRVTTDAKPFEEISLNQVIEDVVADLQVRIEETNGRVEVGELPSLDADAVQIRRLLQNLIDNSLKFHKAGQPPVVNVSGDMLESDENLCRVIVKDNGIGFEKKYLEKVFAPFQRLHGQSEYEGTGIGMATCRKIVERHNGHITAESEPDQGSTFIITLPIEQPKEKTK